MAKIQTVLKVKGNVQKVGYRDKVQEIALEMGITGYTQNLDDRTVEIVCEGEQKDIEKFKKAISIKKGFIAVKEITTLKTKKATNKFKSFAIKRGSMTVELGGRLDTAIMYLDATKNELKDTMKEGNAELGNKMDKGFHTLGDRIDNNFNKMEQKYDVISKSILVAIEELKQSRDEQKETRAEVKAIVENLTKVVQTFTEQQRK